jgi:hypothetical protein
MSNLNLSTALPVSTTTISSSTSTPFNHVRQAGVSNCGGGANGSLENPNLPASALDPINTTNNNKMLGDQKGSSTHHQYQHQPHGSGRWW